MSEIKTYSLLQITKSLAKTITERCSGSYWIKAELNKLNFYSYSGNCYPELVEKSENKIVAQMKGIIWKNDFLKISEKFRTEVKEELKDGVKILFLANIIFDTVYGLSLRIIDINVNYSLGDLENEKRKTISFLKDNNIFDKNKKLPLPLLPKRLAIISVETSKGLIDFNHILQTYSNQFTINTFLFPSILQGEGAISGIINQLSIIKNKCLNLFDAVCIIRGGGGDIGLSCFNHKDLCQEIANFPLPIFCGIGHATNETVAEMICFYSTITPTKLAEYFIHFYSQFSQTLNQCIETLIHKPKNFILYYNNQHELIQNSIKQSSFKLLTNNLNNLINIKTIIVQAAAKIVAAKKNELSLYSVNLTHTIHKKINLSQHNFQIVKRKLYHQVINRYQYLLQQWQSISFQLKITTLNRLDYFKNNLITTNQKLVLLNPSKVLKKGFAMLKQEEKLINNSKQINNKLPLKIILFDGEIETIINKIIIYE